MLRSVGGFLLLCKPHRALPGHGVLAIFMNANPFTASRLLFLPFALLRRATWHFRETVFHPNRLALSTTSRSNYQRIRLVALPSYTRSNLNFQTVPSFSTLTFDTAAFLVTFFFATSTRPNIGERYVLRANIRS